MVEGLKDYWDRTLLIFSSPCPSIPTIKGKRVHQALLLVKELSRRTRSPTEKRSFKRKSHSPSSASYRCGKRKGVKGASR